MSAGASRATTLNPTGQVEEGVTAPALSVVDEAVARAAEVKPLVKCHYCGLLPGNTVDHIVPRVLLPRAQRMLGLVTDNSVKACQHCNGRKSAFRVDCCERCLRAWETWGPPDWEITVQVVSKIWVAKKARELVRQ